MTQKHLFIAAIFSMLTFSPLSGQQLFQKSYDRAFNEAAVAMCILSNGDYVLTGYIQAEASTRKDLWIMRLNGAGDVVWTKTFAQAQSSSGSAIEKTKDGNLLVCYNIDGATNNSSVSGWMKVSEDGAMIWSKKAIGSSLLTNISLVATGGYLLCGQSFTNAGAQTTGLLVRITEDGSLIWSSVFGENGSSGVSDCWEDALGFIHCCGYTRELNGNKNGFWAKLNAVGELIGPVRRYGSSSDDELLRIVPSGIDRLLMGGYSEGFNNSAYSAAWFVEIDYSGNLRSSKIFSLAENNLTIRDMIAAAGNQFLVALGLTQGQLSPAILMKLNVGLDQLFASQYKGGSEADAFSQVLKTSSGFAAVGNTFLNGDANAYLVSTDVEGRLDNDDCCPLPLDIIRLDVMPETAAFVPTQTAFYAVQNSSFNMMDAVVSTTNLCQAIALDFSLSPDTICPGECLEIMAIDSTPGVQYQYTIQGGEIDPDFPGQVCHTGGATLFITRIGKNNNCEKSYTKRVDIGSKNDRFPNAFTPNGDGANDVFRPVFSCPAVSMNFQVFNRWGKPVFETKDPAGGWNGQIGSQPAASDVYVWKLEYEAENNGVREKLHEQGEVTLLR